MRRATRLPLLVAALAAETVTALAAGVRRCHHALQGHGLAAIVGPPQEGVSDEEADPIQPSVGMEFTMEELEADRLLSGANCGGDGGDDPTEEPEEEFEEEDS